ncbi:MAG: hypothetical protein IJQ33_07260 [Clostridia bacterium]|nr:hypothetical protein [Clostridia bacterium]
MEPLELQRLALEGAEEGGKEDAGEQAASPEGRRADFQALIEGPFRQEFEEAVNARVQQEMQRIREAEAGKEEETRKETDLRQHFAHLTKEAEELKKSFPDFDLTREMMNPAFVRMTSPAIGVSVKDAFYAIHGEDIQRESMLYAALQAGRRIAASVQAGASRPVENGIQGSAPVVIGIDIRGMSRKQREEYRRRIHSGEAINFRDRY